MVGLLPESEAWGREPRRQPQTQVLDGSGGAPAPAGWREGAFPLSRVCSARASRLGCCPPTRGGGPLCWAHRPCPGGPSQTPPPPPQVGVSVGAPGPGLRQQSPRHRRFALGFSELRGAVFVLKEENQSNYSKVCLKLNVIFRHLKYSIIWGKQSIHHSLDNGKCSFMFLNPYCFRILILCKV